MKKVLKWALDRPLWQSVLICVVPVLLLSMFAIIAYALYQRRLDNLRRDNASLELELRTRESDLEARRHEKDYEKNVRAANEYRDQSDHLKAKIEAAEKTGQEFLEAVKETQSWKELDKLLRR
jgi:hypothetical protein